MQDEIIFGVYFLGFIASFLLMTYRLSTEITAKELWYKAHIKIGFSLFSWLMFFVVLISEE